MKKNINPIIKTLISIVLLLSLSSCENIFSKLEPLESANSNSSDKAYIKINVVQESSERTIIPTIDLNLLSSISLRGRKADNNNVSDANLLSGSTWEAFSSQTLAVDPGEWEFNLSASLNINSNGATTLRGTKTVTLQQGETTTLNFTLAPSSSSTTTKGGLYVKVNFEDPSKKVTKVVATLMDEAKENIQGDPQSITGTSIKSPTGSPRYIEYKISNSSTYGIEQGTYFLTLEFFSGSDSAGWVSLNTISSYVRINAYYTSAATFDLDLNELYTITYKYYLLDEELSSNTGISIAADSPSTVLPTAFSRRSAITLPTLTYSDTTYQFAGWYESNDFSGTPVTGIARGSFGNKTLYARFISSTLYVSQTGNNENNGLTESTALATVTKAVEQIISYGNIAADYTIKISGTIPGGQIISSSLTTAMATSLTIEGVTGKTGDTWVDVLDGGFTESNRGTTFSINSAVPITLKNLKITGGYQGGGSGAGIKLAGDSTLVMESGEISGNTGNDSGQASAAGVYISHGGTANFGATQIAGAKFTMNGGSICNNTGTGVTLYDGSNPGEFNMYGGTITGNSGYGVNIVYSTGPFGKFTMKGSATVTSDNKVRLGLPGNTKIYIADALTGTAPVATITLNGYNENTEVVALAEGVSDTSLLSAACAKIEVAPYNETPWYLTNDGKITVTDPNGGGDPSTWTGSIGGHDYVDLGLPSGTLWATMNVGATLENRYYGDYFSWGETEPRYTSYTITCTDNGEPEDITVIWKTGYEEDGYKWNNYFDGTNGENFTIFKDADSSELDATHDAATVNWGSNWKTPTKDQCSELINNCFMTSTNDYNNTGIAGIIVYKAFAGDEGEDTFGSTPPNLSGTYSLSIPHIFFPLSGRFPENNFVSSYELCAYLWSSTLEPSYPGRAYQFSPFNTESYDPVEFDPRANGEPIRPVVKPSGSNENFVSVTGNGSDIPNLLVGKNLVTQTEYEQFMTYYGSAREAEKYVPATTDDKSTTPAYFVSWADAMIYCNALSIRDGLTPVYKIGYNDTDPEDMYGYYGVEKVNDKYYVSSELDDNWNDDSDAVSYTETANGYRLATIAEYQTIASKNVSDSLGITSYNGINEWCRDYQDYRKRAYFSGDITGDVTASSFDYMIHTSHEWGNSSSGFIKMGFRLVSTGESVTNADFVTVSDGSSTLKVCKHMVTQSEYEEIMTYFGAVKGSQWANYIPSGNKDSTPAYYMTLGDAIVYCNLRSISENKEPVYKMGGKTDPAQWGDYGVSIVDGKYYVSKDNDTSWNYKTDSGALEYDYTKSGYRIAESDVYKHIGAQNATSPLGLVQDSDIYEWCEDYDPYGSANSTYLTGELTSGMDISSFSQINHTSHEWGSGTTTLKLGLRVIRNAE